jgi:hypothetical protein
MKRVYNLIFILNILLGLFIFSDYFLINNYSFLSIVLLLLLSCFYIFCSINYSNKKYKQIDKIDFIVVNISLIFMIFIFVFGVLTQMKYTDVYVLMYYNFYLFIIHILLTIYFIIR